MPKYLLQTFEDYKLVNEKSYKSLKDIERQSNIPYHQLRAIYLQSKKKSKYLHPHISYLYEKYRILLIPQDYQIDTN